MLYKINTSKKLSGFWCCNTDEKAYNNFVAGAVETTFRSNDNLVNNSSNEVPVIKVATYLLSNCFSICTRAGKAPPYTFCSISIVAASFVFIESWMISTGWLVWAPSLRVTRPSLSGSLGFARKGRLLDSCDHIETNGMRARWDSWRGKVRWYYKNSAVLIRLTILCAWILKD